MSGSGDSEILQQFKLPEQRDQAFQTLVSEYQERLYWHCRKILIQHEDANDALQNTFIKVWKNLADFRADSGLYTWLFRIATNESLTLLKSKKRMSNHSSMEEYEFFLSESLVADPYFDGNEIERRMQMAILTLPEKQRLVFNMKYHDDLKYDQISEILNTSVGALKASYHHAVKKIEKYMKE